MADEGVLAFLHGSADYRRQGLGHRLLACVCRRARERGARLLYISAIPSNSAVGFYTGCGARPAERVDPERFALEPEDIHLALAL
jgi:GNAT superfamily N-acetyltransferase